MKNVKNSGGGSASLESPYHITLNVPSIPIWPVAAAAAAYKLSYLNAQKNLFLLCDRY